MDHETRHRTLKKFTRVIIVIFTWGLVALIPDQAASFFEGMIVAAFASGGEYFSMVLDESEPWRFWLSMAGLIISMGFLAAGIMGLGGQIQLDLSTKIFSFGPSIPLPNASNVHWSYYRFVSSFLIFVVIPVFESMIRRPKKKEALADSGAAIATTASAEYAGGGN